MNTRVTKKKFSFIAFFRPKKALEEYADLVEKNIRMLLNDKKAPAK